MHVEKLFSAGFLMLLVVAAPLGILSWRNGSLLQWASSSEAVFRRRRTTRAFALCAYLLLAVGTPYINWLRLQDQHAQTPVNLSQSDLAIAQDITFVIVAVVAGVGLWLLCFCFPEELRLNLDKRTYRLTKGWPPLVLTQSGTWDDIGGIYIKDIRSVYLVCLDYKCPVGRWTLLGISGRHSGAVILARELATRLTLPLINPPAGR